MKVAAIVSTSRTPASLLATVILLAGASGMTISFLFLASSHPLDVLAGAAGFVAGGILLAAGTLALNCGANTAAASRSQAAQPAVAPPFLTPAFTERWSTHFDRNQLNRTEPEWAAPIALQADVIKPLLRSLEQFQLGDGGGPASLIAWNVHQFTGSSPQLARLVDRWFAEEEEHARLLKHAVDRFGGTCIEGHWSFSAFCGVRRWLGVRFELTVLLLTEIVSTVYYRLLRKHTSDIALRGMCRLILRDEAGHIAFHRDRLAQTARLAGKNYGRFWAAIFRTLGFAAATMLWINHAPGLRAVGATRSEFYSQVWAELSRFINRLRREAC
jgi:hypothetical protein